VHSDRSDVKTLGFYIRFTKRKITFKKKSRNLMKALLIFVLCTIACVAHSQYHIDSLYFDKSQFLMNQKVVQVDSVPAEELIKRIKNWGSTHFVNLKEVLVGETEDQLVFNYSTDDFYVKTMGMVTGVSWYIRMVVQLKDGRIRVQLFDDGNAYKPGSYTGGVSIPAMQARAYHLADYFKDTVARKMYNDGLEKIKRGVVATLFSLEEAVKTKAIKADNGDW
jgi:hypothetical protein